MEYGTSVMLKISFEGDILAVQGKSHERDISLWECVGTGRLWIINSGEIVCSCINVPEAMWQNSFSISVVHYRPRADQSYLSPDDLVLNVFKAHQSRADKRPISHPLLALSIMCHCVCVRVRSVSKLSQTPSSSPTNKQNRECKWPMHYPKSKAQSLLFYADPYILQIQSVCEMEDSGKKEESSPSKHEHYMIIYSPLSWRWV